MTRPILDQWQEPASVIAEFFEKIDDFAQKSPILLKKIAKTSVMHKIYIKRRLFARLGNFRRKTGSRHAPLLKNHKKSPKIAENRRFW